jgi:hypothetical protein
VISEIERRLTASEATITWRHSVGTDWRQIFPNRPQFDIMIVNGEGTIHHSATRQRASLLASVGPLSKSIGIPAFLINASLYEIDDRTAKHLHDFDGIWVRESQSAKHLKSHGIDSEVVPDLTLGRKYTIASTKRKGIVGTDSVLKNISQVIETRCKGERWPLLPILHRYKHIKNDKRAAEYANRLSRHRLVVTGRFHVVALCIATHTPFVAVESNTPKISALLRDVFGDTRRIIDIPVVASFAHSDFDFWTQKEYTAIQSYLRYAERATARMTDEIRSVLYSIRLS